MKKINAKNAVDGILLYAEKELLPNMSGWKLFTAGAALVLLRNNAINSIEKAKGSNIASVLGLIDSDGMIDFDSAIKAMKESARKLGKFPIEIPVLDIEFTFTEKDVEALRTCIEQVAGIEEGE